MYRLLIVSKQVETLEFISSISEWGSLGFKTPHIRTTSSDAAECMKKHAIDAIGINNGADFADFRDYIDREYPDLPIFPVVNTKEEQLVVIREVSQLLDRIKADDINDSLDASYMMYLQRIRWMRHLISGMENNPVIISRRMLLYRCSERPDDPCIVGCLSMCQDDSFLTERWHYGQDRLEMALHNFFGSEYAGMKITVAVVSPSEVRILFCSGNSSVLSEVAVTRYITETAEQIGNYLGLTLHVREIRSLKHITDFSGKTE